MKSIICQAIRENRLLSFSYNGYPRVVEPHVYGITTKGKESLRCYQVRGSDSKGEPTGWHLITVSKITTLSLLEEKFFKPRPDYNKGDKDMLTIFCEL